MIMSCLVSGHKIATLFTVTALHLCASALCTAHLVNLHFLACMHALRLLQRTCKKTDAPAADANKRHAYVLVQTTPSGPFASFTNVRQACMSETRQGLAKQYI